MLKKYLAHNSLLPIYFAWQLNPTGSNYNLSFSYQFESDLQVDHLIEALQKLIKLKAYLRQTFSLEKDQLVTSIHDDLPARINFLTISMIALPVIEQELAKEGHEINVKSAIKLNVIRFNDSNLCSIVFNIHHIIMDGYSLDCFIIDLNRLLDDKKVDEESVDEYISRLTNESPLQEAVRYPLLNDYINNVNVIADQVAYPPENNADTVRHYTDVLPNAIGQKLTDLCQQQNISLFNLLLLAWSVFTAKIYNQQEALVSYPVNIRTDKFISGCFINVVIFPLSISGNDTFLSLIDSWNNKIEIFKQVAKSTVSNQFNIGAIPSFACSNFSHPLELIIQGVHYTSKNYPQMANSNLSVKYREQVGGLFFSCELLAGIFPEYFARFLLGRFFNYLNKLLINPSILLSTTDLTFPEERQRILYDFNDTDTFYPQDKTLVDLFDEMVIKYPNKVAVKAFDGELSYFELNNKAEKLANFLIENGIKPDDIVGILIDGRLAMIIAIVAVLKAGGAYLPLAYNTPVDSVVYNLRDSKAKFLLTLPSFVEKIHTDVTIVNIEESVSSPTKKYLKPLIKPSNLAYVIYTSGTTGSPKAILLEHHSVVNYVNYLIKDNKLNADSVGSKYAGFGFDASVIEIYPILLSGGTLCILKDEDKLDCSKVNDFFNKNHITYAFLPTQFAELFFHLKNTHLNTLIVGGDKLTNFVNKPYRVINAYGPTEATVQSTSFLIDKPYENIPIGKPISNVKCYVVDEHLNVLPPGIIGELIIGGKSLARGYLNNSVLVAEKFIANPFQTTKEKIAGLNARLYKTGDLVRWLPDGNLEYIGRNDFQVKIRGYRIELGEIENKLISYPEIKQAVVIAKNYLNNNGNLIDKHLVAYYVADRKLDSSRIHDHLAKQLPEYMLPSILIHLKVLPLTINGKVDRKKLPELNFASSDDYLTPSNEQEQLVCSAFAKVLGLKKVGVNADFFRLGGNSIKAITLVVNLQDNFKISIADIFSLRTPKKIAKYSLISKDNLRQHLEKVKLGYKVKNVNTHIINIFDRKLQNKIKSYLESIDQLPASYQKKLMTNVLLTGATGFLGCNLLNQLLMLTEYKVFLLVRADSPEKAFDRVNRKFQFYFDKKLDNLRNQRLFIFAADIEKKDLGLSKEDYELLVTKIDSIIHSAALIKHYGEYDKFYATNVQATINLLELSKLTHSKDFHYISTISVLNQGYIPNCDQYIFTEDDTVDCVEGQSNIYIKSKSQGERKVIDYRQQGITSSIYRVGNLAFIADNQRIQENSEDNAFFSRIKCFLNLGIIAKEISIEEISPVDLTAQAIIKLFDKKQLSDGAYHIFNPNLYNFIEFFSQNNCFRCEQVSIEQFIDVIINHLYDRDPARQALIERFLLHQGWLNQWQAQSTAIRILQNRTQSILQRLGFRWLPINHEIFNQCLNMEINQSGNKYKTLEVS